MAASRFWILGWRSSPGLEIRENPQGSREPVKARGTLPFMAPEQLKGEPVDPRTDIYALGNILYQMATELSALQESLPTQLANEILTKLRLRPDASGPISRSGSKEIILKCLEKDPENRYQSVREIAVDLRRLPSAEISRPDIVRSPRRGWRAWRSRGDLTGGRCSRAFCLAPVDCQNRRPAPS